MYILKKLLEQLLFHFHPNYSVEAECVCGTEQPKDTIREQNEGLIVLNNQQMNQADN